MKWWLGLIAGLSSAAGAAPTYLSCSVTQEGTPLPVEVTLDETDQRAIVTLPTTGRAITKTGLFSPTEVRITDEPSTWVVDRVTLEFHRIVEIGDHRSDHVGKCEIKPAPAKRAF